MSLRGVLKSPKRAVPMTAVQSLDPQTHEKLDELLALLTVLVETSRLNVRDEQGAAILAQLTQLNASINNGITVNIG